MYLSPAFVFKKNKQTNGDNETCKFQMREIMCWLDYYSICLNPLLLLDLIPVRHFVAVQLFYNSSPGCAISCSTIPAHLW